jgi:hypothetical protein
MPANSGSGDVLGLGTSSSSQFGDSVTAGNGTPILALSLLPNPNSFSLSDTTSSLAIVLKSPSKLGGGTYTVELREGNTVIQTLPGLQPSSDQLFFNIHPLNGTFDLSDYIAIVYKN